jgi:hypothetical protein
MKLFGPIAGALVALLTTWAMPLTANPATLQPVPADALAGMVGVDTHFGANIPYRNVPAVKVALESSNIRHVRDGSPGALPPSIHNGVALGLDKANPYNAGSNGAFSETEASVARKIAGATNADYIELCGNEQDNDKNTVAEGTQWPTMLADCVVSEVGFINAYYASNPSAARLPIAAPSIEDLLHGPLLAAALGPNKNLIDFANFHPGTGSLNPGTLTSCTNPGIGRYGFPRCPVMFTNKTLQELATQYATGISKTGAYIVTEWGFSDKKDTTVVGKADSQGRVRNTVTNHIYNRVNGIPESQIAAYDVRSLLQWYAGGAKRLYIYQFADVPSDCTFGAQGLVTALISNLPPGNRGFQDDVCGPASDYEFASNTVTLKPEYFAVNNFISLFSDEGPAFRPNPVQGDISVSNSANVKALVAEKRDRKLYVALWREENDYDWIAAAPCTLGSSVMPYKNDYPTLSTTPHQNVCKVTSESATVSIPGYTPTRLDVFQPDGSIAYTTSNIPTRIPLATPYASVLELSPK